MAATVRLINAGTLRRGKQIQPGKCLPVRQAAAYAADTRSETRQHNDRVSCWCLRKINTQGTSSMLPDAVRLRAGLGEGVWVGLRGNSVHRVLDLDDAVRSSLSGWFSVGVDGLW